MSAVLYVIFDRRWFCLVISCCALLGAPSAFALSESEVLSTSVTLKNGLNRDVSCVGGLPGKVAVKRGELRFNDYKALGRKQKVKFKRTGNTKFRKRLKLFRQIFKTALPVCRSLQTDPGGGGGSDPGDPFNSTASPSPSPSPSPSAGGGSIPTSYFLADGRMNDFGKSVFGIPSNLDANLIEGQSKYFSHCSGCHIERPRQSFAVLRAAIAADPMNFTEQEIPDDALADIMAWLLRFRSPAGDGLL